MNWKMNILIDKDGRARLTGFVLSFITQESAPVNTTTWAAPEILRGGGATKEGDVFTFAMVAVEVRIGGFQRRFLDSPTFEQTFTGRTPFVGRIHAIHSIPSLYTVTLFIADTSGRGGRIQRPRPER